MILHSVTRRFGLATVLITVLAISLQAPAAIALAPTPSLMDQGRDAYAAQRFIDAAAAWEEAAASFFDQPLNQALALSYLTTAYQQLNQWEAADRTITQSLERLATLPHSAQRLAVSAQAYNTQGSLQFARGQAQNALQTWQIAADLYAQTGDESRYFNCLLNQVQAQQSRGYYQQARQTLTLLEQRLPQQSPSVQVLGYQRLGQTYRLLGDRAIAQARLQTALNLAQQENLATGAILLGLANVAQAGGDWQGAIALYQQAEQSTQSNIRLKARLNQLSLLAQYQPDAARQLATNLPPELAQMPPGRGQIYAYINTAQSLLQLSSPAETKNRCSFTGSSDSIQSKFTGCPC